MPQKREALRKAYGLDTAERRSFDESANLVKNATTSLPAQNGSLIEARGRALTDLAHQLYRFRTVPRRDVWRGRWDYCKVPPAVRLAMKIHALRSALSYSVSVGRQWRSRFTQTLTPSIWRAPSPSRAGADGNNRGSIFTDIFQDLHRGTSCKLPVDSIILGRDGTLNDTQVAAVALFIPHEVQLAKCASLSRFRGRAIRVYAERIQSENDNPADVRGASNRNPRHNDRMMSKC